LALKSQPVLKMTIPERGTLSTAVVGLAMLHNQLYVVYKKSFNVFVYDTKDAQLRQVSVTLRHAALLADNIQRTLIYTTFNCVKPIFLAASVHVSAC